MKRELKFIVVYSISADVIDTQLNIHRHLTEINKCKDVLHYQNIIHSDGRLVTLLPALNHPEEAKTFGNVCLTFSYIDDINSEGRAMNFPTAKQAVTLYAVISELQKRHPLVNILGE